VRCYSNNSINWFLSFLNIILVLLHQNHSFWTNTWALYSTAISLDSTFLLSFNCSWLLESAWSSRTSYSNFSWAFKSWISPHLKLPTSSSDPVYWLLFVRQLTNLSNKCTHPYSCRIHLTSNFEMEKSGNAFIFLVH